MALVSNQVEKLIVWYFVSQSKRLEERFEEVSEKEDKLVEAERAANTEVERLKKSLADAESIASSLESKLETIKTERDKLMSRNEDLGRELKDAKEKKSEWEMIAALEKSQVEFLEKTFKQVRPEEEIIAKYQRSVEYGWAIALQGARMMPKVVERCRKFFVADLKRPYSEWFSLFAVEEREERKEGSSSTTPSRT